MHQLEQTETVTTLEDTVIAGNVVMTDVDGNALTASVVTGPAHGTLPSILIAEHSAIHLMLITTEPTALLIKSMTVLQIVQSKLLTSTLLL